MNVFNNSVGDLSARALGAISKNVEVSLLNKFNLKVQDIRFVLSTVQADLVVEFYFAIETDHGEIDVHIPVMIGAVELRGMFDRIDASASYMMVINYLVRKVSVQLDKWSVENQNNCRKGKA